MRISNRRILAILAVGLAGCSADTSYVTETTESRQSDGCLSTDVANKPFEYWESTPPNFRFEVADAVEPWLLTQLRNAPQSRRVLIQKGFDREQIEMLEELLRRIDTADTLFRVHADDALWRLPTSPVSQSEYSLAVAIVEMLANENEELLALLQDAWVERSSVDAIWMSTKTFENARDRLGRRWKNALGVSSIIKFAEDHDHRVTSAQLAQAKLISDVNDVRAMEQRMGELSGILGREVVLEQTPSGGYDLVVGDKTSVSRAVEANDTALAHTHPPLRAGDWKVVYVNPSAFLKVDIESEAVFVTSSDLPTFVAQGASKVRIVVPVLGVGYDTPVPRDTNIVLQTMLGRMSVTLPRDSYIRNL